MCIYYIYIISYICFHHILPNILTARLFWSTCEKGPADFANFGVRWCISPSPLPTANVYLPAYMHLFSVRSVGTYIVPHIRLVGLPIECICLPCDWRGCNLWRPHALFFAYVLGWFCAQQHHHHFLGVMFLVKRCMLVQYIQENPLGRTAEIQIQLVTLV